MSSTKRRKIDPDTASNASGRNSGSNNAGSATAASASAAAGRRGGGGPGSRGGHSAATASRAAAAAATTSTSTTGGPSVIAPNSGLAGNNGNIPGQAYVPVLRLPELPVSALSKYALHYGLVPPEPLTVAQATFPTPALPLLLKLSESYTVPSTRAIGGITGGGASSSREGRRNRSPYVSGAGAGGRASSTLPQHPAVSRTAAGTEQRSEEVQSDVDMQSNSNNNNQASTSRVLQVNGDATSGSATPTNNANAAMGGGNKSRSSSHQGIDATSSNGNGGILAASNNDLLLLQQSAPEWIDPGEADAIELRGMTAFEGGEEQLRERLGSLARTHWDKLASVKEAETVVNFAYAIRMRSKILKSAPMV